jgi:hypothetical protein
MLKSILASVADADDQLVTKLCCMTVAKEYSCPYPGRYLSYSFIEQAPTDEGVPALLNWVDKHLKPDVVGETTERTLEFVPIHSLSPSNRDQLMQMAQEIGDLRADILKNYSQCLSSYILARTPEEKRQKRMLLDSVKDLATSSSFQLWMEVEALEYLFSKAAAIAPSNLSIELLPLKPNLP